MNSDRFAAGLMAALVISAACGGGDGGSNGGDDGGQPTGGSDGDSRTVTLTATEYAFSPSTITAEPGEVLRVRVSNGGTMEHSINFELPGGDLTLTPFVQPGEEGELEVTVPDETGDVEFYCPVVGHRALGMTGTLRVEGSSVGTPSDDDDGPTGGDDAAPPPPPVGPY